MQKKKEDLFIIYVNVIIKNINRLLCFNLSMRSFLAFVIKLFRKEISFAVA